MPPLLEIKLVFTEFEIRRQSLVVDGWLLHGGNQVHLGLNWGRRQLSAGQGNLNCLQSRLDTALARQVVPIEVLKREEGLWQIDSPLLSIPIWEKWKIYSWEPSPNFLFATILLQVHLLGNLSIFNDWHTPFESIQFVSLRYKVLLGLFLMHWGGCLSVLRDWTTLKMTKLKK